MIPIFLKIQGIYSYKRLQEVDFTKLTEASIFGIFGKVGSGKSTILEAIMLALYGEVARIKKSENRNYNIMNLDSNDLYIDFVFESGDQKFRSEVKGKRNKKKFDKIETFNTTFYVFNQTEGAWIPKEDFDPVQTLGLTIEDFRKTVILPQNSFQDFLHLNKSDRTDMMKRLFRLEKYDLADKAYELEAQNKSEIDIVKGSLLQIGVIEPETPTEKEMESSALQREINHTGLLLNQYREEENKLTSLNKKFQDLNALKEKKESLELQDKAITDRQIRLEQHLLYAEIFKIPLFQFDSLKNENKKNTLENEEIEKVLLRQLEKLNTVQSHHAATRLEFENRAGLKTKAEDLRAVYEIKELEEKQKEKEAGIQKGAALKEEIRAILQTLSDKREKAEEEKTLLDQKRPDLARLNALKDWFNQRQAIIAELERLKTEAGHRNETVEKIELSKRVLIKKDLPLIGVHISESATLAETIAKVKEANNRISGEMESVHRELSEWNTALKFENAAASLSPGLPCPICGSVHHPNPLNPSDVHKNLKEAQKNLSRLKLALDTVANITSQLETNLINYLMRSEDRKSDLRLVKAQEKKDVIHLHTFIWKDFQPDQPRSVDAAFARAEEWHGKMKELDRQLTALKRQTDLEREKLEKYQSRLQVLTVENAGFISSAATLKNRLKDVDLKTYDHISLKALEKEINQLNVNYERIEKSFHATELELTAIKREADVLSGKKEESEKRVAGQTKALAEMQEKINRLLDESNISDLEEIRRVLSESWDVGKEQKLINEYYVQKETINIQLLDLTRELKNDTFDPDRQSVLVKEILDLESTHQSALQKKGTLEAEIIQLKRSLKETSLLKDRLYALEIRGEHIKTLRSLFREKGFVNYVSSLHLRNLCAAANERFKKLTRQRLSLELGEDNNFKIIDLLNNGRERHIKTLSGGQTFQAALCLALALADSVQPRTGFKQNFFFLDEGFGGLDRESLATIFETLKSLRQENRIVGVISHVEEMQQEMERYLIVTNGVDGSDIEMF